jgi:hypothetical protein
MTSLNLLIAASEKHARDVRDGLIIPHLDDRHRARVIKCGHNDAVSIEELPDKLRTGTCMLVVVVTSDSWNWEILGAAERLHKYAPFGVVVLTQNANAWRRLATYQHLAFVLDASGEPSLRREQAFPKLQDIDRFKFVDTKDRSDAGRHIVRFLGELAVRTVLAPASAPIVPYQET